MAESKPTSVLLSDSWAQLLEILLLLLCYQAPINISPDGELINLMSSGLFLSVSKKIT